MSWRLYCAPPPAAACSDFAELTVVKGFSNQLAKAARPEWLEWVSLGAAISLLWGVFVLKLRHDWSTNPQYEFGLFVPFFIIYLLWRRSLDKPTRHSDVNPVLLATIGGAALLLYLPIRFIQEANPDWRPLNWVYATDVVVLTLVPFAFFGGRSWVRHFIFPLLLIFFALPWPLATEQSVLQTLTRLVTRITVEMLNWMNIPALQHGNVIEVFTGSVGIADACSGIRSLAGTLMASAFFGEFYRLGVGRRILLIVVGVFIALTFNLCRTFFLGWRAAADGVAAVSTWHDPAGLTIFMASFAALWFIAVQLTRPRSRALPLLLAT